MTEKPIRGIDHIGITVPDIESATAFLIKGLGAQVIYNSFTADQAPLTNPKLDTELNLAVGTQLIASRMLKLGVGPGLELFELKASDQRPAARPSDFGLQSVALYVDDMTEAIRRF